MSINILIEAIKEKNNPTVAGLDSRLDYVPQFIKDAAFNLHGETFKGAVEAILQFNKILIDNLCDIVPAIKPQSACYEMYGYEGIRALEETVSYAQVKGLYVIADAKRNDIGVSAEAYATAFLGETKISDNTSLSALGADSVTVNGYLGIDGISPFLKYDKCIFVLAKTSNTSSGEVQDKSIGEYTVYQHMAYLADQWGKDSIGKYGYNNVGIVVGATYPEQIEELRKQSPNTYFLIPGYGAQGGGAKDVAGAFNEDGLGAIINASRSIMCAYKKSNRPTEEFGLAARDEAIKMRDDILSVINKD